VRRPLILATDLDGTFLEGSEDDRRSLARLFWTVDEATLVFVSGRGVSSIGSLLRTDPLLPTPDYVIGDVGATVVHGGSWRPVEPLQGEIDRRWSGSEVVRETLRRFEALVPQDVLQERRCSFFADEGEVDGDLRDVVESIGCDLVFSNGRFLDILPKGVSKGRTLQRLLTLENLDPAAVVVAGDTLNDLSLFELALKGVLVGNAEPAVRERVAGFDWVYRASRPGGAGILEGLRHHGFLAPPSGGSRTPPLSTTCPIPPDP
jgi:sucrose-6F-phosphate phosphohydrolase